MFHDMFMIGVWLVGERVMDKARIMLTLTLVKVIVEVLVKLFTFIDVKIEFISQLALTDYFYFAHKGSLSHCKEDVATLLFISSLIIWIIILIY